MFPSEPAKPKRVFTKINESILQPFPGEMNKGFEGITNKGILAFEKGDYEEAEEQFSLASYNFGKEMPRRSKDESSRSATLYFNSAIIYEMEGDSKMAKKFFSAAKYYEDINCKEREVCRKEILESPLLKSYLKK